MILDTDIFYRTINKIGVQMKSLLVSLVLLISLQSFANEYFVSTSGNDNNPGTKDRPFAHIQYALSQTSINDSVTVLSGTYNIIGGIVFYDDGIVLRGDGTVTLVYLSLYPMNDKFINFNLHNRVTLDGFIIDVYAKWGIWIDGDSCIVKNCTITGTRNDAINIIGGSYNIISNTKITNVGVVTLDSASTIKGNGITVEGKVNSAGLFKPANYNIIDHNNISQIKTHFGINLAITYADTIINDTNMCVGNKVRYNIIDSSWSGVYVRQQKLIDIYDNIIIHSFQLWPGNEGHGIKFDCRKVWLPNVRSDAKVYNNTIAFCEKIGIYNYNSSYLYIYNNSLYQNNTSNSASYIEIKDTNNIYLSHNSYYGDNLLWKWNGTTLNMAQWQAHEDIFSTGDPAFVNPIDKNFYPLATSDLRGNGMDLKQLDSTMYNNIDIIKHSRPSDYNYGFNVWDIGAYEYYGDLPKHSVTLQDKIINYSLSQNYPNPFNPVTTIKCNISAEGKYLLKIYNVLGEEITVLNNGVLPRGEHSFTFNAANLPSGVYIYRLTGNNVNISKKMMLIK
jgi:hypothetical protein